MVKHHPVLVLQASYYLGAESFVHIAFVGGAMLSTHHSLTASFCSWSASRTCAPLSTPPPPGLKQPIDWLRPPAGILGDELTTLPVESI